MGTNEHEAESQKNQQLDDIAARLHLDLKFSNLSEHEKAGARLSSMVMHLNHRSFDVRLV